MDLRDVKEFCIDTSKYIITIFVVIFIIVYVASVQQVVGSSMSPTFKNQDILILNKMSNTYERFDIVVINYKSSKLIKRIIGLPNETIEYNNNQLYINGKRIEENYEFTNTEDFTYTTKNGEYFVLGDNRSVSFDGRLLGPVDTVVGKTWFFFKKAWFK